MQGPTANLTMLDQRAKKGAIPPHPTFLNPTCSCSISSPHPQPPVEPGFSPTSLHLTQKHPLTSNRPEGRLQHTPKMEAVPKPREARNDLAPTPSGILLNPTAPSPKPSMHTPQNLLPLPQDSTQHSPEATPWS